MSVLSFLLACLSPGPPPLAGEREQLRAAEVERYASLAEASLQSGALVDATTAIVAGLEVDAERFAPHREALLEALAEAPFEVQARVHATLYEAATTAEARALHRQAATDAQFRARYATPEATAITEREQVGVDRARALAALDALFAEYVQPLEVAELVTPAAHRLSLMLDRTVEPPSGSLSEAFDALALEGRRAGLPESRIWSELTEAAFEGADPWSSPVWPAQIAAWRNHHDGVVPGVVGMVVDRDAHGVFVRQLVPDGAAYASGVHVGDRIVRVRHDGGDLEVTDTTTAEEVAGVLRGPDGATVTLAVDRAGTAKLFVLARSTLSDRTVFGWRYADPDLEGVKFAHVDAFRSTTLAELDALLPTPPGTLILDLRGNPGGDLEVAVQLVDRFVETGPMIGLEGRTTGDPEVDAQLLEKRARGTIATPGHPWEGTRLAVLVDPDTASSAEIVAGALQQRAGAHVIGSRTAGKGVSQVLRTDEVHGIALQFTNLTWALPDGRHIHRTDRSVTWGIPPDTPLVLTPSERFAVGVLAARREALDVHADGSPMPYGGVEWDPALPGLSRDPQVVAALAHLGVHRAR